MTGLRDALDGLGQPFNVVYMLSCLMGGLEVAYQIRDKTEYLLFSEEIMWAVRALRAAAIQAMWMNNGRDMALGLANIYANHMILGGLQNDFTVSVIATNQVDPVAAAVDAFAGKLIVDMDNYKKHDDPSDNLNVIWRDQILPNTQDFEDENFIDLKHIAMLTMARNDFAASGVAQSVITSVQNAVIFNLQGGHPNAYGMHVYHPVGLRKQTIKRTLLGDRAYDNPSSSENIYALDSNAKIDGFIFPENHGDFEEVGFLYPQQHLWDEFLIRFYKSTADACIRKGGACTSSVTMKVGETVKISGVGSSDGDPIGTGLKYWWDTDLLVDSPVHKKVCQEGQKYFVCEEDCDRNNVDDNDDDPDKVGPSWDFKCETPGKYSFKLWIWDAHNEFDQTYKENLDHNDGNHYIHFQVDSEIVNIECNDGGEMNGDPHFRRWKHTSRDSFHGECDLVVVHSDKFHKGAGFDLYARTTIDSFFSYIESVAMRFGEYVIEFERDQVFINGIPHSDDDLPLVLGHDDFEYMLKREASKAFQVVLNEGSWVTVKSYKKFMSLNIDGHNHDLEDAVGLLGDYRTGEMYGRDGHVISNVEEFGFEWQVGPEDAQLFREARDPQLPYERCRMPSHARPNRRHLRAANTALLESAKSACVAHEGGDFNLCVDDVMMTGDIGIAHEQW